MKRNKITILPADDPNKIKRGYKFIEVYGDMTMRNFCKDILSPEDFKEMEQYMIKIEKWKEYRI